jgi:predicted transglutaminase-like cysteine proteinase
MPVLRTARPFLALLAGTAAVSLAGPANAQSYSKTDAILGGAPSALQAILAQQRGAAPARAAIQPASLGRPQVVQAVLREGRPLVSPGVANGRPDVFGSVALRVGRTRLDRRWHNVEYSPVGGAASRFAEGLRGRGAVDRLEAVNWYVNKRVRFVDDERQYGRADVWATAGETLRRGRGDCEDFAIAKLQMLRRAGVSDRDLYLVIVKDLVRRSDHAVLVVRAAGHMYVLDNGTDELLDSESVSDYRPILTFAAGGTWTHGYRVREAPVEIASNEVQPLVPAADGADQRSRSASLLAFNAGFIR